MTWPGAGALAMAACSAPPSPRRYVAARARTKSESSASALASRTFLLALSTLRSSNCLATTPSSSHSSPSACRTFWRLDSTRMAITAAHDDEEQHAARALSTWQRDVVAQRAETEKVLGRDVSIGHLDLLLAQRVGELVEGE